MLITPYGVAPRKIVKVILLNIYFSIPSFSWHPTVYICSSSYWFSYNFSSSHYSSPFQKFKSQTESHDISFPPTTHTHTHTTALLLFWNLSETTRVSRYQKGKTRMVKTNLDLLEQEIVSGSGICWAICKFAPHPRQPCKHPTPQFLQAGCPSCRPTNSVKALIMNYIILPSFFKKLKKLFSMHMTLLLDLMIFTNNY